MKTRRFTGLSLTTKNSSSSDLNIANCRWEAGKRGSKEECLQYIKETWTDMRPLSLRKKMEDDTAKAAVARASSSDLSLGVLGSAETEQARSIRLLFA